MVPHLIKESNMPVNEGDFIRLSFTGRVNGIVFDTTRKEDAESAGTYDENKQYVPQIVCAGKQQILLGLDEAILGQDVGYEGIVEIPPEKAFGEHESELMRSFEKKVFKEKPVRGMRVSMPNFGEGTVVNIIGNRVIVDFNHVLAGQTLNYTIKIEGAVEDPAEKVKGIVQMYSGTEVDVTVNGKSAEIVLPAGVYSISRRFLSGKPYITVAIFDLIDGIDEISYIEKFTRPEKKVESAE
jgi:FKBP-type peptidyl-prolyl cis-trans isomerase 2